MNLTEEDVLGLVAAFSPHLKEVVARLLDEERAKARAEGRAPFPAERCCICGSPEVTYHNYRDYPFCGRCSEGLPPRAEDATPGPEPAPGSPPEPVPVPQDPGTAGSRTTHLRDARAHGHPLGGDGLVQLYARAVIAACGRAYQAQRARVMEYEAAGYRFVTRDLDDDDRHWEVKDWRTGRVIVAAVPADVDVLALVETRLGQRIADIDMAYRDDDGNDPLVDLAGAVTAPARLPLSLAGAVMEWVRAASEDGRYESGATYAEVASWTGLDIATVRRCLADGADMIGNEWMSLADVPDGTSQASPPDSSSWRTALSRWKS